MCVSTFSYDHVYVGVLIEHSVNVTVKSPLYSYTMSFFKISTSKRMRMGKIFGRDPPVPQGKKTSLQCWECWLILSNNAICSKFCTLQFFIISSLILGRKYTIRKIEFYMKVTENKVPCGSVNVSVLRKWHFSMAMISKNDYKPNYLSLVMSLFLSVDHRI